MICREFVEFLDAYVGGALAEAQRAEFDAHIAACVECRAYLASYRKTVELARSARRADPLPEDAPPELVRAILAARKRTT
ncbi:MAG: zf-HC2 domain-containing protein [Planctomycetes bacterium]|nr:zf-HC2 domain-containing protein [Planctomycetota bacterium]